MRRSARHLIIGLLCGATFVAPLAMAQDASSTPETNQAAELFYQMQLLQEEVLQLRGTVEEQSREIKLLKQRRLDDYLNLDKRIHELSEQIAKGVSVAPAAVEGSAATKPPAQAVAASDEKGRYTAAYALVKERRFPQAKEAFIQFLTDFPKGDLTPNAHYWLGELYLIEQQLTEAQQAFSQLLDNYPKHRKIPDAMYKKAVTLFRLGQAEEAKQLLLKVQRVHAGSRAARLAKSFFDKNFPAGG